MDPDPYSGPSGSGSVFRIRIRIHTSKNGKRSQNMLDLRYTVPINYQFRDLTESKFLYVTFCSYSFEKYTFLKTFFLSKKIINFFFLIDSITQDPDPNSMFLDP